jgi:hypothetical protein
MSEQYKSIFLSVKNAFVGVTNEYGRQDAQNKQRNILDTVSTSLITDSHSRSIKNQIYKIFKHEIVSFILFGYTKAKKLAVSTFAAEGAVRSPSGCTVETVGTSGNSFQT